MRNVAAATVLLAVTMLGVVGCSGSGDETTDAQVRSEIATSLDAANITGVQVSVIDGAVTLTGTVPDQASADRVAEIAKSAKGAKSVANQIVVTGAGTAPTTVGGTPQDPNAPDGKIAAKVNLRLLANPELAGSTITTSATSAGVVTLTGTVPSDAAKTAAEKTAKQVEGVTSVVLQLNVVAPSAPSVTVPDSQLRDNVNEALDKQFPDLTLFVSVTNGNVSLNGAVPNRSVILQVSNAIRAIPGVKAVDTSHLTVKGGEGDEKIGAPAKP